MLQAITPYLQFLSPTILRFPILQSLSSISTPRFPSKKKLNCQLQARTPPPMVSSTSGFIAAVLLIVVLNQSGIVSAV
ncbi:unnamed protein product [Cuscuta campestris]|uniref:Uncharacterized protein n=1 Tax=Cuscuta campestris TaxID=132261 RepID=A0A484KC97_9ASTE|nr:unnamed protein product [Cuscuta campestris]